MFVFVHGVPEASFIWDGVREQLEGESVALALPGFGCERPEGFGATKDDYVHWLLSELTTIDGPIDLVGHDWGAGLTYRFATAYGERLRSWSADIANVFHPDYVWHDFARIWQTPGDGEDFFVQQLGSPLSDRAAVFEMFGVPREPAIKLAGVVDDTMASCILDLYRSARPNPYASWGAEVGVTIAPGMVLCPSDDPFGDETLSRDVAARLGARHEILDGVGHFWPLQHPAVATLLNEFVASVS